MCGVWGRLRVLLPRGQKCEEKKRLKEKTHEENSTYLRHFWHFWAARTYLPSYLSTSPKTSYTFCITLSLQPLSFASSLPLDNFPIFHSPFLFLPYPFLLIYSPIPHSSFVLSFPCIYPLFYSLFIFGIFLSSCCYFYSLFLFWVLLSSSSAPPFLFDPFSALSCCIITVLELCYYHIITALCVYVVLYKIIFGILKRKFTLSVIHPWLRVLHHPFPSFFSKAIFFLWWDLFFILKRIRKTSKEQTITHTTTNAKMSRGESYRAYIYTQRD